MASSQSAELILAQSLTHRIERFAAASVRRHSLPYTVGMHVGMVGVLVQL
jgi:hypothetical protein